MNERIENTYTRSGRIANPTEQGIENTYTRSGRIANPTEQEKSIKIDVFQMSSQKKNGLFKNLPTYFRPFPTLAETP